VKRLIDSPFCHFPVAISEVTTHSSTDKKFRKNLAEHEQQSLSNFSVKIHLLLRRFEDLKVKLPFEARTNNIFCAAVGDGNVSVTCATLLIPVRLNR
jgi:hypothetical protein